MLKTVSQVAAFIKSERPARYPGLTIKYVRGADPIIKVTTAKNTEPNLLYWDEIYIEMKSLVQKL